MQVPAITTVLRAGGESRSGPWFKPEHRERGRVVHAACLVHDLGSTPVVLPEYDRYLDGWRQFMRETRPTWRELEQPRVERRLLFAGTPDRRGLLRAWDSIVEIKTGRPAKWHGTQTAGQDLLIGDGKRRRRFVVYLPGDGRYRLREYDDVTDYLRFMDCLRDAHGETNDDEWEQDE